MKTCAICGTQNPDTASCCSFCGMELKPNEPARPRRGRRKPAPVPPPRDPWQGQGTGRSPGPPAEERDKSRTRPELPQAGEASGKKRNTGLAITLVICCLSLALTAVLVFWSTLFESAELYEKGMKEFQNAYTPVEQETVLEEDGVSYVGDQLVVVSSAEASYEEMEDYFRQKDMRIIGYVELIDTYQLRLSHSCTLTELRRMTREMQADPQVDLATINAVRENTGFALPDDPWDGDPKWSRPGASNGNWGMVAIRAPQSWDRWEPESVSVGVLDSVFDGSHPDLRFAGIRGNSPSVWMADEADLAHGTHVAGILGAVHGNGIGCAGVAENCELYAYSTSGYEGTIDEVSVIADLAAQGVRVINYSMGIDEAIRDKAIAESGVEREIYYSNAAALAQAALEHLLRKNYDFVLVCAAGNEPLDAVWASEYSYITEPTIRDRILVVGAAGIDGSGNYYQPAWCARGERIDLLAPGVEIYSTVPGGGAVMSGSSMAVPHVAGVCASVWAIAPQLSGAEVKRLVVWSADTPVRDGEANLVNMYAAMAAAEKG